MRILHITKKYPDAIGGDAVYVASLEKQQKRQGDEVFILAANCLEVMNKKNIYKFGFKDETKNWDRITFKRIASSLLLFFYFPFIFKKIKPDIIHAHAAELGFLTSFWAKIFHIPIILTCHVVIFPYKEESLLKRILDFLFLKFSRFTKIITVDAESLKYFERSNFKNYLFLPVGVDLDFFKRNAKTQFCNSGKLVRFLFVGRLEEIKGLNYLLNAAKMLVERNKNFELYIVGAGSLQKELRDLTQRLNLKSQIKFLGPIFDREKLSEIYNSVDIFILPSVREWCPTVILEAWAANLAVITTNTGSISKICTHLENAFLIPPQNLDALCTAMLTLIEDEQLRRNIANNGRRLAEEKFLYFIINQKLKEIYLEIQK